MWCAAGGDGSSVYLMVLCTLGSLVVLVVVVSLLFYFYRKSKMVSTITYIPCDNIKCHCNNGSLTVIKDLNSIVDASVSCVSCFSPQLEERCSNELLQYDPCKRLCKRLCYS